MIVAPCAYTLCKDVVFDECVVFSGSLEFDVCQAKGAYMPDLQ